MVVAILLATLWPLPEQAYRASLSPVACLVCGDQGMQDVIQNVLMLLPLGPRSSAWPVSGPAGQRSPDSGSPSWWSRCSTPSSPAATPA